MVLTQEDPSAPCPMAILPTINLMWTGLGLNAALQVERLVTDCLRHGAAGTSLSLPPSLPPPSLSATPPVV